MIRPDDDFYETPQEVTEALLAKEQFEGTIWEPACGKGAVSRVLKDYGNEVYSSDLTYRGYGMGGSIDFLTTDIWQEWPPNHIVTNPPFKLAKEFAERALSIASNKVALFLRLAFLESQARKEFFENTPLAKVYVCSKRVTMYPANYEGLKGVSNTAYAWFVWDKTYTGEPVIRWI